MPVAAQNKITRSCALSFVVGQFHHQCSWSHRRCWPARPDLGWRWPSRLGTTPSSSARRLSVLAFHVGQHAFFFFRHRMGDPSPALSLVLAFPALSLLAVAFSAGGDGVTESFSAAYCDLSLAIPPNAQDLHRWRNRRFQAGLTLVRSFVSCSLGLAICSN